MPKRLTEQEKEQRRFAKEQQKAEKDAAKAAKKAAQEQAKEKKKADRLEAAAVKKAAKEKEREEKKAAKEKERAEKKAAKEKEKQAIKAAKKAAIESEKGIVKWQYCEAKQILIAEIVMKRIPLEDDGTMSDLDVYNHRPEFAEYAFVFFPERLSACREQVKTQQSRSKDDQEAYDIYIKLHPKSSYSQRGYPEWEGSDAQRLLLQDLADGKHDNMKPKKLRATRPEYCLFPKKVFRDHIYQMLRTEKYLYQLKVKGKSNWRDHMEKEETE